MQVWPLDASEYPLDVAYTDDDMMVSLHILSFPPLATSARSIMMVVPQWSICQNISPAATEEDHE